MRTQVLALACAAAMGWAGAAPARPAGTTLELAREIAADAYVYGHPLVVFEETAKQVTNVREPAYPFAPADQSREANRLPAPDGPMGVVMRLHLPRREVLDGTWRPPPIRTAGPAR